VRLAGAAAAPFSTGSGGLLSSEALDDRKTDELGTAHRPVRAMPLQWKSL